MENDSIRAIGGSTLVDIWIDGKLRSITISREAIGAYLGFDQSGRMTDDARAEFVRANLPLLVTAAKAKLKAIGSAAEAIIIDADDLPRPDGRAGDRRKVDRRKGERRKVDVPKSELPHPDRRRGDRRSGERRSTKRAKDA